MTAMSVAVFAAVGLVAGAARAVTPPASVANMAFIQHKAVYNAAVFLDVTALLQADGTYYEVSRTLLNSDTPPVLRRGSYTYVVNADGTASITMTYAGGVGVDRLQFETPNSGTYLITGLVGGFSLAPLSGAGRLVNLSSRSLVNSATPNQAGFVIDGTVPRYVMVRVVGPSLVPYGVTDAALDPAVTVFHGETVVAQNDNWEATADALTDVSQVSAKVGAFPLLSGSKDAALVALLKPGIYLARGSAAQTGQVLVEVYLVP